MSHLSKNSEKNRAIIQWNVCRTMLSEERTKGQHIAFTVLICSYYAS